MNLQEVYINLTESEVFPNSKIDSIVYHGTNNQFDEFDVTHRTNNGKMYGQGIYFTIDEDNMMRDMEQRMSYQGLKMEQYLKDILI